MDSFQQLGQQFGNRFTNLDISQKIIVGTLVLAMVFASVFLAQNSAIDYDVLYANMSVPDAAATVAKLKEMKKPYRLADGGTTILVPRGDKNQLILETADELTSNQPISLAKIPPILQGDVQKEWLRQFNSDTIGSTLESIGGIRNAKVIVAQPEQSVFSETAAPVQASVMLVVEPGFRLKEAQIKTIKNLVGHSVPGLDPKNVAISDNSGNSLEDPAAGGVISDTESKRTGLEKELQKKVMELLLPIVGKDNAVVSVSADLNMDQARAKIHSVLPTNNSNGQATGVVVSAQNQTEEYAGGPKGGPGGQAGTSSNTAPVYQANQDDGAKGKNFRSVKSTTNYANSEEDKEVIYASGTLKRLTVAVVLNKVLTQVERDELKETIASAVGADFARGDSVDVKGFQFSASPGQKSNELTEAFKQAQQQEFIMQMGYLAAVVILGASALFIFYNLLKRPASGELVEDDYGYDEEAYGRLPGGQAGYEASNIPILGSTPAKLPVLESSLDPEIESMRLALYGTIKHDPTEAARVLVSYMKDEQS